MRKRVIILGAAGRDFHNFNVRFRDDDSFEVVAFTAAQIPNIEGRVYPKELSGRLYPDGIPIYEEGRLEELIVDQKIDIAVFSYSDVPHTHVMHIASRITASGADFVLLDAVSTMIPSKRDVVSVTAVRTGCGKSQTSRMICDILKDMGKKVVAIRHPMPYGDLKKQMVQRFSEYSDFEKYGVTIEEREEYEPMVERGIVVYAGVDYGKILEEAEKEAEVVVWDGGNNDTPFLKPDLNVVIFDPHRAGHELLYHPGETNLRMCDVAVINKVDTATDEGVNTVRKNIEAINQKAKIIYAESPVSMDNPEMVKGKRVLVVEDGPTVTHGEMGFGAGIIAAETYGAAEIVDPRPFSVDSIRGVYEKYPHLGKSGDSGNDGKSQRMPLPAMGYGADQMEDLEETINSADCDLVIFATPIDLTRIINIKKPTVRVRYSYRDSGSPTIVDILNEKFGG
ncbi:MAG: GTPase [Deltaproteobacteria bacterium]|uniref:GTPase n=1 Tax=Candidatus Zymogenus saltonus TaxID=2844893 RepID=A0A9D8KD38_9DELT|nr:GTPase [Candidatus Zymogenus saltonus]